MRRRVTPRVLGALGALGLLAASAFPARAAERFTQKTDVVAVEIPVQVVRDGKPVTGLKAADFEIFDGKKRQTLTGFEVFDLNDPTDPNDAATGRGAAQAVSPAARRRFLLFFDLGFSQQTRLARAQDAARRLLAGSFHASDLLGVATYTPSKGPQLLLGFTPDRGAVRQAIDDLGYSERNRYAFDPLELGFLSGGGAASRGAARARERREAVAAARGGEGGGDGDDYSEETDTAGAGDLLGDGLSSFRTLVEEGTRTGRRQDMDDFLVSVESFARILASVQGRKQIVLLSEGFDSSLLLGSSDGADLASEAESSSQGRLWEVSSDKRFGNTKSANRLEKMLEALRRSDCVVQAVDIAGVRETGGSIGTTLGSGEDGLFAIANGTGGDLYRNYNDLGEAVGDLLQRTSVTYVLSFQPDVGRDGAYHPIRVELKNRALGKAVYRPGYYAPVPYAQQKPIERLLQTAGTVISGREGGTIPLTVLAVPFALSAEKAYVPVLIEIDGAGLLGASGQWTLATEIYAYALDARGTVTDYFNQKLGLDLAKVGGTIRAGGIKFFGDLELPPGSYTLRVLVRNGHTGASGLRALALDVPVFGEGKAILLPAFLPAPTDRWLMARETQAQQDEAPFPFLLAGKPYIPASRPTLQPEQEATLSLIGYGLAEGDLAARASVLTVDGKEAGEGSLRLFGREAGEGGVVRFAASFRPPKLAPGEYVLLLTLTDANGSAETSATPFVISALSDSGV